MTIDHRQAIHYVLAKYANEEMIDLSEEAITFLDSCCWALAFGGTFGDEVVLVAAEVLEERPIDDRNRTTNLDYQRKRIVPECIL
jgi:hypothetical protein